MRTKSYLIIILFLISLSSFVAIINEYTKIQEKLTFVVENLENATFDPVRVGWQHDYGLTGGGVLNKYEYVRSLFSYEDFQSMLNYPIYISGPHTKNALNLNSEYTFGHYNPKFVSELRSDINEILINKYFVKFSKPILEKYNFLALLKRYKAVYSITINEPEEFKEIKTQYINGIEQRSWNEGSYRYLLPDTMKTEPYWNWGETSYHFWIRRDIDNTKEIWIGMINDILNAYE